MSTGCNRVSALCSQSAYACKLPWRKLLWIVRHRHVGLLVEIHYQVVIMDWAFFDIVVSHSSSSFVYHRIRSLTQSVGAMLWSMAQLRRCQLRMVVCVVGSCWWCGQLSVLARHTHMPHCPPVPTSSWMLCTDRPQCITLIDCSIKWQIQSTWIVGRPLNSQSRPRKPFLTRTAAGYTQI